MLPPTYKSIGIGLNPCRISFAPGSKEVMALEADYIDSGLNTFLGSLIDTYSTIPWTMDTPVRCLLTTANFSDACSMTSADMRALTTPAGIRLGIRYEAHTYVTLRAGHPSDLACSRSRHRSRMKRLPATTILTSIPPQTRRVSRGFLGPIR